MRTFFIHMIMLTLLLPAAATARELSLTLDDAIAMARVQSVDAAVALDELKTAYWQWRSYRACPNSPSRARCRRTPTAIRRI